MFSLVSAAWVTWINSYGPSVTVNAVMGVQELLTLLETTGDRGNMGICLRGATCNVKRQMRALMPTYGSCVQIASILCGMHSPPSTHVLIPHCIMPPDGLLKRKARIPMASSNSCTHLPNQTPGVVGQSSESGRHGSQTFDSWMKEVYQGLENISLQLLVLGSLRM